MVQKVFSNKEDDSFLDLNKNRKTDPVKLKKLNNDEDDG